MSKSWAEAISDLFVNLAAGWIGAVVILPNFFRLEAVNWWWLIFDLCAGILSLRVAVMLKEYD